MEAVILLGVLAWVLCGALGSWVGAAKEAEGQGFGAGLLFGPLGVIAALGFDGRGRCPVCRERLSHGARRCPHCREQIQWARGRAELDQIAVPPLPPQFATRR